MDSLKEVPPGLRPLRVQVGTAIAAFLEVQTCSERYQTKIHDMWRVGRSLAATARKACRAAVVATRVCAFRAPWPKKASHACAQRLAHPEQPKSPLEINCARARTQVPGGNIITADNGCPGSSARSNREGADPPAPLSPVSQLFLGLGDAAPDIYAILRLRGRASLADIRPKMQQLVDAHDRFRCRVSCRDGVWCTELLDDFDAARCMRHVMLEGSDIDVAFNGYVSKVGDWGWGARLGKTDSCCFGCCWCYG